MKEKKYALNYKKAFFFFFQPDSDTLLKVRATKAFLSSGESSGRVRPKGLITYQTFRPITCDALF